MDGASSPLVASTTPIETGGAAEDDRVWLKVKADNHRGLLQLAAPGCPEAGWPSVITQMLTLCLPEVLLYPSNTAARVPS